MLGALVVLLIALPVAELYVIVKVAHHIGVWDTLGLLVVLSLFGGWLLKREGIATWRRLQDTLRSGRMPGAEVADGALILLGGALLLTPGFISDAVGLVLLFPPTRAVFKGVARRALARWTSRRMQTSRSPVVYTTTARPRDDINRSTVARSPSDDRPELGPHDAGGSPDKG